MTDTEGKDVMFLRSIIESIVDNKDAISIERKVDEMGVLLTLVVDKADMAQVVGKGGRTAGAIRTLLRVVGMKSDARVNLKINEPEE